MISIEKRIGKFYKEEARKLAEDLTDELYIELIRLTPVDTGTYQSQHRKKPVQVTMTEAIGEVENTGEYSEKVEKGWRKTAVNWHTNEGIYRSIGANTYKRAVERIRQKLNHMNIG